MIPAIVAAAVEALECLAAARVPACVIGGLAVQRWGEPRTTQDVDITARAGLGGEGPVIDALLARFVARVPDAHGFALEHRVLLIQAGRVPIDVALAGSPFELEALHRASPWAIVRGATILTCAAEDLILYKLVAGRPRDVADIAGIVERQRGALDVERVRRYAALFAELKEDPALGAPFEQALTRAQEP